MSLSLTLFGQTPEHDLGTGAARQADAEEAVVSVRDLAVGQAAVLVEVDDGGLGVGAKLAGGGAGGVTGLQGVVAAAGLAAALALAALDVLIEVRY